MKIKRRRSGASKHISTRSAAMGETREKLLDAAQDVFVELGFYDATVRQICKRAGVNLALVNYHFGDKFQLYIEVFRRAMNLTKLHMLEGVDDPSVDPVDSLHDLVLSYLRHMKQKQSVYDILMAQERVRPTPAMDLITEKLMRPAYEALCTVIGRILKLPAAHETTRLVTHSVIAQIKHFGEPEMLLTRLDPTILAGRSDEEITNSIVSFSLAGPYPHGTASGIAKPQLKKTRRVTKRCASIGNST